MAHKEQALCKYYQRFKIPFQKSLHLVPCDTEYNTHGKSGCLGVIPARFQIGGEPRPTSLRYQILG